MDTVVLCPNCGKPYTGVHCSNCEARVYDFTDINNNERPTYVKLCVGGRTIQFRAFLSTSSINVSSGIVYVADNNIRYCHQETGCATIELDMICENSVLFKDAD